MERALPHPRFRVNGTRTASSSIRLGIYIDFARLALAWTRIKQGGSVLPGRPVPPTDAEHHLAYQNLTTTLLTSPILIIQVQSVTALDNSESLYSGEGIHLRMVAAFFNTRLTICNCAFTGNSCNGSAKNTISLGKIPAY